MAKRKKTTAAANSAPRQGVAGYPYHVLDTCLNLGDSVKKHGGRNVPKAVIASELSMSEAAFSQLCTSAKTFGIVDGARELSLTEGGHDYFFPTTVSDMRRSLLGFVSTPPLFRSLIERFDGNRLPSQSLIVNLAQRQLGVKPSWAQRAVGIFLGTLHSVGAIDAGGFLRFGAAQHQAGRTNAYDETPLPLAASVSQQLAFTTKNASITAPLPSSTTRTQGPSPGIAIGPDTLSFADPSRVRIDRRTNQWVGGGGIVRVETPYPLTKPILEELKRYVGSLAPTEDDTAQNKEESHEEVRERSGGNGPNP